LPLHEFIRAAKAAGSLRLQSLRKKGFSLSSRTPFRGEGSAFLILLSYGCRSIARRLLSNRRALGRPRRKIAAPHKGGLHGVVTFRPFSATISAAEAHRMAISHTLTLWRPVCFKCTRRCSEFG